MPDPTAYLATMAGASATLVAIIGGLSVSKFVGLDAEQLMTKREFEHAKQKADAAAYQLRLAETRHEDRAASELAANDKALRAIYGGLTDHEALRYDCGLSKVGGELAARLMQRAQEALGQAKAYFADAFPRTQTALAVQDWSEAPSWAEVREAELLTDVDWPMFWELAYDGYANDEKDRQWRERRVQRRGISMNPELERSLDDQQRRAAEQVQTAVSSLADLSASIAVASRMVAPRITRVDQFWHDVTVNRELNRAAQTELARMREQWERSISPDGRQLVGGLLALLVPTILGVVVPVLALSMSPTEFTMPILVISYGFYLGLAVLFGYMFYLASRLILGHEKRMRRVTLPFRAAGRWVSMTALRLHLRRAS